jgi:hypothetical protein
MAVGPTESLQGSIYHLTPFQVQISNQVARLIQNTMKGVKTFRINPDTAIPPANSPQNVRSEGIGGQLDLSA